MKTVIVKSGDTLSGIAERELGDSRKWKFLFELNWDVILSDRRNKYCVNRYGRNSWDWIFPNMILRIE